MTKKDYILIANAIKEAKASLLYATTNAQETKRSVEIITFTLANALSKQNPLFDFDRFAFACGIESQNTAV